MNKINKKNLIKNQKDIVKCMLNVADVNKIFIFGSYARGEATKNSDIDFYIILNTNLKSYDDVLEICYKIRKELIENGLYTRMDILVSDKNNFNEQKEINGSMEYTVNTEGVIIYE